MKRITLLLFLLLSLTSFAQNTKPLSKKETKEFIEQIKALVSIGDYEAAISLSQEKSTLIEVKNVAKADRAWWESTKDELAERNNTYNNNEALVKAARQLYYNRKYWECNEALNALNLDRSYARISTLNELATLKSNMAPKQEKMVSITEQMPAVIELYQSKDAEQLFWTFFNDIKPNFESSAGDITDYLSPDYRPIIKELIKDYEPQWEAYRKAYYTTVREPSKTIESMLIKKDMGRNNAQKLLDLFNTYQSRIENCRDYPAEQYPVLAQGHRMVLDVLPEIKSALNNVIKESDPFKVIMGGGIVSLAQIESDCIERSGLSVSALSMDVCSYYGKYFKSDLQKSIFMETDEYKSLYKELQAERREVLKTVYYSTMEVETGSYNVKDGCFYLKLGTNKGIPAIFRPTAEVHHPKELDNVIHEAFPIAAMYDKLTAMMYTNGDRFVSYHLKMQIPKSIAASYEDTKCKLVVCFVPAGVKTYKVEGASYDGRGHYDIFYANKEYPYTTKCRVFLFTKKGELIYDKFF